MMRQAGSSAAGSTPTDGPASPLYVYGVVEARDDGFLPDTGVGDPPGRIRAIADGGLAALVSPLPGGAAPGRREDLEAHERVLSEMVQRATVVPMRFGVVMDGEEMVRQQLLRRHAPVLEGLLEAVRGRVQMTLKAFYTGDTLLREVMAARPDIARRAAEVQDLSDAESRGVKIWLGEVIADELERRREADEQHLLQQVSPVVDDVRVEPPANERVALNAQVLLGRDRRPQLDAVVNTLTEEGAGRLAFRYVGPLAPYSFADMSLESEESPWG
jgi:hypothetical protein